MGARRRSAGSPRPARKIRKPEGAGQGRLAFLLESHLEALGDTYKHLAGAPVATGMIVLVIGIALLLPALFQLVSGNLALVGEQFRSSVQITVFLHDEVSADTALDVSEDLRMLEGVSSVEYISKQRALEEFEAYSGFAAELALLGRNPLPASLVVVPADQSERGVEPLLVRLRELPGAQAVQLDQEWLQRLAALQTVLESAGLLLQWILGAAVLFVTGNTVRQSIETRRPEIRVIRLIGGTPSFIARPFLYTGMLLGATGGVIASLLVLLVQLGFSGAIDNLLSIYGSDLRFSGFPASGILLLVAFGGALGWAGALLSAAQHIYLGSESRIP